MNPPILSPMTIADYCAAMDRKEIVPNSEYQRSDKVWPPAAKSFLIETILLGFPIPKMFLFQVTDLKSKKTYKEIVDGQQRSRTIEDFFHNRFAISKNSEIEAAQGKKYDQLDPEDQARFLNYQLSIDLFVSVTPADIRQAFRRLNSYTVALNPEELRHAEWQGAFKWFVYELARDYSEQIFKMGVLNQKQIVRMQDTKLFGEAIHAMLYGIKTTKKEELNRLYKEMDKEFPISEEYRARIDRAMEWIASMPEMHNSNLMKANVFYTLLLAVIHMTKPVPALQDAFPLERPVAFDEDIAKSNLSALSEAVDSAWRTDAQFHQFYGACESRTNVESQRKIRFQWLCKALKPELL